VNLRAVFFADAIIFAVLTVATLVFMREEAPEPTAVAEVGEQVSDTLERRRA